MPVVPAVFVAGTDRALGSSSASLAVFRKQRLRAGQTDRLTVDPLMVQGRSATLQEQHLHSI
jgi:hypothetical protein